MKKSVRIIALITAFAMLTAFFACGERAPAAEPPETPQATETAATEPHATGPPKDETPYKGDGSSYVFIHESGANRRLEEDVVEFADDFLDKYNGQPFITDRLTTVGSYNENTLAGCATELVKLYDPELRDEFIRRINAIIKEIPNLNEQDVLLRLAEAAAILHDAHSQISPLGMYALPIEVTPFYSDAGYDLRITGVPEGYGWDDLLLARIETINGLSVQECVRRISKIVSYETENWLNFIVMDYYYGIYGGRYPYILDRDVLNYCGIADGDSVRLVVTDVNGTMWELDVEAENRYYTKFTEYASGTGAEDGDIGLGLMHRNDTVDEWGSLLSDGETLYFRFNECNGYYSTNELIHQLDTFSAEGTIKRIIMDFRHNPGGYANLSGFSYEFITKIRNINPEQGVFVLIDNGSFSAGTVLPSHLKRVLNMAKLVGTPTAQPTSFCSGLYSSLPNSKRNYSHTKRFDHFWPDNPSGAALEPDVTVYQTLEDYRNGVDSVLNRVIYGVEG